MVEEVWREVTKRLGGTIEVQSRRVLAHWDIDGVSVEGAAMTHVTSATFATELTAPAPGLTRAHVRIVPSRWFSSVMRLFGRMDLTVGERLFGDDRIDDRFVIMSWPPPYARLVCDVTSRYAVGATRHYEFRLHREKIVAQRQRTGPAWRAEHDPDALEAAARATAALAARTRRLRGAWAAAARTLGADLEGGEAWGDDGRIAIRRGPVRVVGAVDWRRVLTRVQIRTTAGRPSGPLRARVGRIAVGPAFADGDLLRFDLDGFVDDPAKLREAMDLALECAGEPAAGVGPYR